LEALVKLADAVLIGGGMANTFLAARGIAMGGSLVDQDSIDVAKRIMGVIPSDPERSEGESRDPLRASLTLPVDLVVADDLENPANVGTVDVANGLAANQKAFDIGPGTVQLYTESLRCARLAFWDGQELTRKLHDLGAQRLYPATFEDNIVLDRRGELRTKGALLRVRKFGKYSLATYKGPMSIEGGVKSREEVQTGVESFELAIQLFDSLGFKPVFRYQKFREVWRLRDVEVVIDRTPIGDYFEIEGAMETIRSVTTELGMSMDQALRQTYADLYRQARRTRADLPEHMVFPADQL